jgi:hypothetical protein
MFPPPNVTNPAIMAIRATAPKINNQRDIISPLAASAKTARKTYGLRSRAAPRNPVGNMDKTDIKKTGAAVCVFCGSSFGNDPAFRDAARAIGSGIAKMGYSLVFGGGGLGLMGDVAKAALAGGSDIQGIMPAFLQALEPGISPQEKLIITPHMQERKNLMLQMSDAFIVLPGGLGTFDEFFEVAVEAQLSVHHKPIIVVNVNGYYDALDAMLHATVNAGFAKEKTLKLYYLADGAEAALKILEGALNAPARS